MGDASHGGTGTDGFPTATAARPQWWIYTGTGRPRLSTEELAALWPPPPRWRTFHGAPPQPPPPDDDDEAERILGPVDAPAPQVRDTQEVDAVNACLYLRRPLLVTGAPGIGKTALAYKVARELRLGRVLHWEITTKSDLVSGLYRYDAMERLRDVSRGEAPFSGAAPEGDTAEELARYFTLGPLGTALLPYELPRLLLIDEFDKSDPDLANDLLHVLEKGHFRIPEIANRIDTDQPVTLPTDDPGVQAPLHPERITCRAFPLVIITSNGERSFPAAFRRRCVEVHLEAPGEAQLTDMLAAQFDTVEEDATREMVRRFLERRKELGGLAVDQLLNSVYMRRFAETPEELERVLHLLYQRLSEGW